MSNLLPAPPVPIKTTALPPGLSKLFQLADSAGAAGVSDIHVQPGRGLWTLNNGILARDPSPRSILPQAEIIQWLNGAVAPAKTAEQELGATGHTSVAFDTGTFRIRASFRRDTSGVSVTLRLVPHTIPDADNLGVPRIIQDLMTKSAGLILIEGPTGSGKTTAIAALINKVNRESDRHVYLIEDPIEFVHQPIGASVFTQREIGVHASDYTSALENALRSTPNVIVVGEMLDNPTKKAALHAATTGHLVLTTAHAGSIVEAIDSFIGEFEAKEQPQVRSRLSQSLLAVMIQQLVPTTRGSLVPVREVVVVDENIRGVIRDGEMHMLHAQIEAAGRAFSLDQSLAELVHAGTITREVAFDHTRSPEALTEHLHGKGGRK